MGLCSHCLSEIVDKLTPNDIYVLHELKDKVTAQTGTNRDEMHEQLKQTMSFFQMTQALMRMELLGLTGKLKSGKIECFYITQSGLSVLSILSKL